MREVNGFLQAQGRKLVNGDGREIVLRGVGFGSWLLPEGYMWRFPEGGDRPRRIERMITELIGEEKAHAFWDSYYNAYIAEADFRRIAEEGFNSVRVPINWRFLYPGESERCDESRLRLLDRAIDWCEKYRLYAVFDLHGAPGGQTGTNIDDSPNDRPELFTDPDSRRKTIDIWRMLAHRYQDRWIVAGYDLLNEPLPEWFSAYNDRVMPLYKDIVRAIREVDKRHMIILEGVHWATDWSIFNEPIDGNLMLQFHKYWNSPDTASIQAFLDKREEWDVPIYMGEGGENNIEWNAGAFRLYEDHHISWNFWTWKKLDTTNSPCSVIMPEGWGKLVAYLQGGERPAAEEAERILWDYLRNLSFDRCLYHPQVVRSLLFRPPVRIPAVFYGFRGAGESYHIHTPVQRTLGFRDADGTDIRFTREGRTVPNFRHMRGEEWADDEWMHVVLGSGDWLAFEIANVPADELRQSVSLRVCGPNGGHARLSVTVNDETFVRFEVKKGGWHTISSSEPVQLRPGQNRLVLQAVRESAAIEWIRIGDAAAPFGR